jgi:hypothetical protein
MLTTQKGLPGLGVDEKKLPREKLLLRWLKDRGWDLTTDVARIMGGVHRTFPGKCLVACTDPLPKEMRRRLLAAGVPDRLLPPPPPPKEGAPRRVSSRGNYCAI